MLTPAGSAPVDTATGELEFVVVPSPSCPLALMPQARALLAAEAGTATRPSATKTTASSNGSRARATAPPGRPLSVGLRRASAGNGVMESIDKGRPAVRLTIV